MKHKKETVPSSHWNYRVMAHETDPEIQELLYNTEKIWFKVHEVYYTNGVPDGRTEAITIDGENPKEIKNILNKMLEACDKPVIWAGEKFPQEYVT